MSSFFCVMKAYVEELDANLDHMVNGGIYANLEHAKEKARQLIEPYSRVWIEEYYTSDGIIDVVTKEGMVACHDPKASRRSSLTNLLLST